MTLSELYCEVFGQKPNGLLWVDSRQLRVDTTLHDAKIMEGTIVSDDEPLGESVSLVLSESDASLGNSQCLSGEMNNHKILVGLSDDPDHQRQIRDGWNLDEGNLLLMGILGCRARVVSR